MRDENNISLKYRVFNSVFVVGICMSFSCSLMNYILGLGTIPVLVTAACGFITVGMYIAFRVTKNYKRMSLLVTIFLSFIFFPAMWIIAGGTCSSIPYYIIVNAGIIALLLTGITRKIVFALFALMVSGLITFEYRRPDFVILNYDSEFVRYIDLSFGLFVCLFAIAVLIAVLIDSYMAELQRSKRYLLALEEKNREIEAKNQALEKSNAEFMKAKEEAEKLNLLLSEEKQKFERLSFTDHLTGAFNKRFITACLDKEVESSRKNHEKLTVAMVDIDNFKNINDAYGHMYGDYVLKRIAKTIKSSLRHEDIVGRYGGDEFFIILRNTGKEKGYAVVERIRKKILELEWESDLVVTISGGVADVGEKSTSELLMKVDRLLYIAKNKSKNSIEMEEDELPEG
jgi:diguanylate cyclase (GGDEF)-like protein